jgi:hypothetical protein
MTEEDIKKHPFIYADPYIFPEADFMGCRKR